MQSILTAVLAGAGLAEVNTLRNAAQPSVFDTNEIFFTTTRLSCLDSNITPAWFNQLSNDHNSQKDN